MVAALAVTIIILMGMLAVLSACYVHCFKGIFCEFFGMPIIFQH